MGPQDYAGSVLLWARAQRLLRSQGLFLALLAPLVFSSCLSGPTPESLLAVGFRTPEQCFLTFQTALRGDLIQLEYRCLSTEFKKSQGVSQIAYDEARKEILRREPFFKLVARAKVVERQELSLNRIRLVAHLNAVFTCRSFVVDFVREDAYLLSDAAGPLEGDLLDWEESATQEGDQLSLRVPMPEGTVVDELAEIHAGREWKIASFAPYQAP